MISSHFAVAVEDAAAFWSAVMDVPRLVVAAVRVVADGFSTTRIGCRSVGSEATRAGIFNKGGASAETESRGSPAFSAGCCAVVTVGG